MPSHKALQSYNIASVQFNVADVLLATDKLPEVPVKQAVEALLNPPPYRDAPVAGVPPAIIEACSSYRGSLLDGIWFHPVLAAVHMAFDEHRPLTLSPDMIWLMIAQGFAHHVNANAETLRDRFVSHVGTKTLSVRRDDFRKGSLENPWDEGLGEFSGQIRSHIGSSIHSLLCPQFTTTGPLERAAAEIVLMDTVRSYFYYELQTMCGIPRIILEGSVDDWERLIEHTQGLAQFDLNWWVDPLVGILKEFVAAAAGHPRRSFWQSIYKQFMASGGPTTTGWITAFFPYLRGYPALKRNKWLVSGGAALSSILFEDPRSDRFHADGPTTEKFPGGLCKVPFLWKYLTTEYSMEFLAGFIGVRQDAESLALRPEIGWAVRDAPA
jgi:hypothetical protein